MRTHHFHIRTLLILGDVAESSLKRYGPLIDTVDEYVHTRIRLTLMHQDNQTL